MTVYSAENLITANITQYSATIVNYGPTFQESVLYFDGYGSIVPYTSLSTPGAVVGQCSIVSNSSFRIPILYSQGICGGADNTYIMRGRYIAGNTYEYWTGRTPTTSPPSGHTLADITVIASY
jgi:hypothetical protein